ncbi:unnamed protein product [Adineta ricciae]|uniref:Uncharacterized protein n=1 Tax=Adineta ricciae TaxID=249248 RepID=A0A814ASU4_ADIRI|nr:unnamed protein product [Adineta ricciae]CAF0916835.1 unnamed protein product [Adineta ricciae]
MEKRHTKLRSSSSLKLKTKEKIRQIHDSDSDNDTKLSIDPNEPLVSDIAHQLFLLAIKQTREERKLRRPTLIDRQTKHQRKAKLKTNEIDHIFEEKRLRPHAIRADLLDLYQKSSSRIRSMLDIRQIDQFTPTKQTRKVH